MTGYHEPYEHLPPRVRDEHRAINSLMEELEAVDWYGQRIAVIEDPELREILAHNRAEEIEHAAMLLEWLRRRDPDFGRELRERLFAQGSIVAAEEDAAGAEAGAGPGDGSLGLGDLSAEGPA